MPFFKEKYFKYFIKKFKTPIDIEKNICYNKYIHKCG